MAVQPEQSCFCDPWLHWRYTSVARAWEFSFTGVQVHEECPPIPGYLCGTHPPIPRHVCETRPPISRHVCGIRPPIPIFVELDYHNFRNLQPRSIGFYSLLIQNFFYSYLSGHMFLSATLMLMPSKARRGRTSIKSSEAVVTGSREPPDVVVRPWSGVLQKSSKHS